MLRQIDDRDVEGVEEVQQCLLHDIVDRSATKTACSGDVDDDRDAAPENSRLGIGIAVLHGGHGAGKAIADVGSHRAPSLAFRRVS